MERHFLNKGVGYKARHARDQADILVSSMRWAQDPDTQKPEAVQPQPDSYKPKHAAETSNHTESQADKNKSVAIAALKLGGLILTGSLLVVGAGMGIGALRRRHRRRQEERAFEQANNHSPDPNDPTTATPSDFSDIREITKQDEQRGYDPVDPPTGAHAATEVRPSPFAPPVEATPSPSKPIQGRARFATPTRPVEPHTRGPRHLRSVSDLSAPIPDLFTRDNRPLGRAESAPETRINDAPTDPASATVLPFPPRKPPLRGRGQVGTDGYIGLHRKITNDAGEVVVPRIQTLRPLAAAAV